MNGDVNSGAGTVTEGTILTRLRSVEGAVRSESFGFGQREIGGASRSLVSAPAGISARKKHSVFIGRLGLSSLQVRRC
jgi:hypothetical protein